MTYNTIVKLGRLLSRVDAGFGWRDGDYDKMAEAIQRKGIRLRLLRVPKWAVYRGLTAKTWDNARESQQHQQLKHIAMAWLGERATPEFCFEPNGLRFDVYDPATHTIVECGHTSPSKILTLGLDYEGLRVWSLPFRNRSLTEDTPLTAVEFQFHPEYVKAHDIEREAAMRRAAAALDW